MCSLLNWNSALSKESGWFLWSSFVSVSMYTWQAVCRGYPQDSKALHITCYITVTSAPEVPLGASIADSVKKWLTPWPKPDGPHYSQLGLSSTVGVRHITDTAPQLFRFSAPMTEQKTTNYNADMNTALYWLFSHKTIYESSQLLLLYTRCR